jgi:hypothetical protein
MQDAGAAGVLDAGLLDFVSAGEEKNNKQSGPCCYQSDSACVAVSDIVAVAAPQTVGMVWRYC